MSVFTALDAEHIEVYPGGGASSTLHVRNTGGVVNEYRVEVLGPSAGWAEVEPAVLPLFPGNEGTFTVTWRPPRTADTRAGSAPFGLRVLPTEHPEDSRVEEGTITLGPFYAMDVTLVPVTSRGRFGGAHRAIVDNQSNAEAAVALTALDPDALLRFRFRPSAFRLAPGASRTIKLRVSPRRHKIRGHDEHRNFQVYASQQGQEPQRVDGALVQRAVVAGWQFKVALLAVLLLIAGLLLANFRQGKAHTLASSSVPLPPVPVHLTAVSTTSLLMTWSNTGVNVFSGYEIQSNGQTVATPPGDNTAYTFTKLNPGQTYCYVIRSIEAKNTSDPDSAFSPQVCAATQSLRATVATAPPPAPGDPAAPVPVTVEVLDATDIKLTWTPKGGTGFVIQDGGQQVATPGPTESAHTFSSLAPGSTHCYVIWAVGPVGTSPHVALPCTTTLGSATAPAPVTPQSVAAAAVGASSIQVSWSDPDPGASTGGYQIFENGSEAATQPSGAIAYTFANLAAGSTHCYTVRSVSATAQSGFSPEACATVPATAPANVNLGVPGVYSVTAQSISPSEPDGRAVVGSLVTYAVTVNIPTSGAKQAVLTVNLPATLGGLALDGTVGVQLSQPNSSLATDVPGGFAAAVRQASVTAGAPGALGTPGGQVVKVSLGDVTNSSANSGVAQTLTIDIPAIVLNNNTGANGVGPTGINYNGSAVTVSAVLTSEVNNVLTTSATQSATVGVANPSPSIVGAPGLLTVTLGSTGQAIYNPQVELPQGYTCDSATETMATGSTSIPGSGCIYGSSQVTFDGSFPSGSTITVALEGSEGCPAGASVEWLSSTVAEGAGSVSAWAWPRSGPDDEPASLPSGTDGDQVFVSC